MFFPLVAREIPEGATITGRSAVPTGITPRYAPRVRGGRAPVGGCVQSFTVAAADGAAGVVFCAPAAFGLE
jgi:hypothetical protein